MLHSLSHQGITKDAYLQMTGKTEDELLAEAQPDAEQALRREAVLAAVIEAEDDRALRRRHPRRAAGHRRAAAHEPEKLRKRLEQSGRLDELREDLAQRAGRRPARRARDADRAGAGRGARQALDAGD